MQEASKLEAPTQWTAGRQWAVCVAAYTLIWSFTFSLLWFVVQTGLDTLSHLAYFGQVLLPLAFQVLCPDWPIVLAGLLLGLLTCLCQRLFRGAVPASLVASLLPASVIFFMFGFSPSGILPALCAVAASWIAGVIVARTWQKPMFDVPSPGRPFTTKQVITVLACLLTLSVPFRLFQWAGEAWSGVLPAKITETNPLPSPDGTYIASTHTVDPNIAAYTDIVIRPRRSFLDLFCGYSASSRLGGIQRVQWTGKRTLCIWRSYEGGIDHWHDVRIVYVDTRSPADTPKSASVKKSVTGL